MMGIETTKRISTEEQGSAGLMAMYERERIKNWFDQLNDAAIAKLRQELLKYFKNNQSRADSAFRIISSYKAVDGESAEIVMKEDEIPANHTDI